ncbi:MAG: sulfite exporter TauE/SafE family protein [Alphaproteobacteria bacterium]|tara:strand:- start:107 stop:1024 length:918 start_codon:yes stop_codon:yes gene_type:complete
MELYLPIAELSINPIIFLILGMLVGILSGMFGVGGGFLMTPLLVLLGIPPAVAVASEANHIVGSSLSGTIGHLKRNAVDIKLGNLLLVGGILGSFVGISIFNSLIKIGLIDLLITLTYFLFLTGVGSFMLYESLDSMGIFNKKKRPKSYHHSWIMGLPIRMRFKKSGLYISIIPPLVIGFVVGILASIMGVGGGFIMIPAMIYIIRMPTSVVIGTSLYQIIFVTAIVTLLHSYHNQTVDIILALILLLGGAIGAQIGVKLSSKLKGPMLRASLAVLVLSVGIVMASDLLIRPDETITLLIGGGSH